jgi:glutamate 5-kinase
VLLSDVDGFLMDGALQEEVREVTPAVEAAAGGTTGLGSGGMISKIRCAKTVTSAGGVLLLAHGKRYGLVDILEGRSPGTLFAAKGDRLDHHKRWLAHSVKPAGTVTVDAGGAAALRTKGKSLLPVGVTACEGEFEAGDAVDVKDPAGAVVARGLASYSASELRRILGKRTEEIEKVLGYRAADEAIHRDNLVLLG